MDFKSLVNIFFRKKFFQILKPNPGRLLPICHGPASGAEDAPRGVLRNTCLEYSDGYDIKFDEGFAVTGIAAEKIAKWRMELNG
jgi:hypothetical protein